MRICLENARKDVGDVIDIPGWWNEKWKTGSKHRKIEFFLLVVSDIDI